ncbi:MAG: hypothetical protein EDM03_14375 [Porphyrobacter sp. IPPAS B-1204]|nr:MAG: hypothetical protein EDM03_14375 [Porphyrobacter sp. IPPAS B-1204]
MDFFGGPAVLGGIIMCVALGAWMLGRWQGGLTPAADQASGAVALMAGAQPDRCDHAPDSAAPATPCQQAAQAERRGALEAAPSLGDLHAEVSAYRRAQQVLTSMGREQLDLVLVPVQAGHDCRYLGVSGQPTCPMPAAVRHGSACGSGCTAFRSLPQHAVQPSPAVSDFTRV